MGWCDFVCSLSIYIVASFVTLRRTSETMEIASLIATQWIDFIIASWHCMTGVAMVLHDADGCPMFTLASPLYNYLCIHSILAVLRMRRCMQFGRPHIAIRKLWFQDHWYIMIFISRCMHISEHYYLHSGPDPPPWHGWLDGWRHPSYFWHCGFKQIRMLSYTVIIIALCIV